MKVLIIKQIGPLVIVETSGGIRSSGSSVEKALGKIASLRGSEPRPGAFAAISKLFDQIRDDGQGQQIRQGVQS